jgi:hypothetical protein
MLLSRLSLCYLRFRVLSILPVVALFWRLSPGLSSVSGRLKASEEGLYPRGSILIARVRNDDHYYVCMASTTRSGSKMEIVLNTDMLGGVQGPPRR